MLRIITRSCPVPQAVSQPNALMFGYYAIFIESVRKYFIELNWIQYIFIYKVWKFKLRPYCLKYFFSDKLEMNNKTWLIHSSESTEKYLCVVSVSCEITFSVCECFPSANCDMQILKCFLLQNYLRTSYSKAGSHLTVVNRTQQWLICNFVSVRSIQNQSPTFTSQISGGVNA